MVSAAVDGVVFGAGFIVCSSIACNHTYRSNLSFKPSTCPRPRQSSPIGNTGNRIHRTQHREILPRFFPSHSSTAGCMSCTFGRRISHVRKKTRGLNSVPIFLWYRAVNDFTSGEATPFVPAFRRVVRRLHRRGGAGAAAVSHERTRVRAGGRGASSEDGQVSQSIQVNVPMGRQPSPSLATGERETAEGRGKGMFTHEPRLRLTPLYSPLPPKRLVCFRCQLPRSSCL